MTRVFLCGAEILSELHRSLNTSIWVVAGTLVDWSGVMS